MHEGVVLMSARYLVAYPLPQPTAHTFSVSIVLKTLPTYGFRNMWASKTRWQMYVKHCGQLGCSGRYDSLQIPP